MTVAESRKQADNVSVLTLYTSYVYSSPLYTMYQFLNRPVTHALFSIHKPNVNRTKAGGHNRGRQIKWAHKTEFCDTWESEQNDTQISPAVYQKLVVYSGYQKTNK